MSAHLRDVAAMPRSAVTGASCARRSQEDPMTSGTAPNSAAVTSTHRPVNPLTARRDPLTTKLAFQPGNRQRSRALRCRGAFVLAPHRNPRDGQSSSAVSISPRGGDDLSSSIDRGHPPWSAPTSTRTSTPGVAPRIASQAAAEGAGTRYDLRAETCTRYRAPDRGSFRCWLGRDFGDMVQCLAHGEM
jgi:hypothetical protein